MVVLSVFGKLMKEYKEYRGSGWESVLTLNNLDSFDAIWDLKADWFEEPNIRRGGWSGVCKIKLETENGDSVGVFLKRQENHNTKSWLSRFRGGIPTFYREFKNIIRLIEHDVPTIEPIYFCYRYKEGKSQAILISKDLEGFESLDSAVYARDGALMQDKEQREKIMSAVAKNMYKMHSQRFQHRCLHDKHVFVALVNDVWEVRFLDLEMLRRTWSKNMAMERDLYTFSRRMIGWQWKDKLKFFKMYMDEDKLSSESKVMWHKIIGRLRAKNKMLVEK
jgi:hypothetical protein